MNLAKQQGHKVNIQKLKKFLYTNNEISEIEIRKKIPFDKATRKIRYLGIKLTKEVKDLYSENYTTLKKEIKEDTIRVHGLKEITSPKISILPKAIYRFNAISIRITMSYFTDTEQIFQNVYGTMNDPK